MENHFNAGPWREADSGGAAREFPDEPAPSARRNLAGLHARYLSEVRLHLQRDPAGDADRARNFGHLALTSGLATVDLARMHEATVAMLASSSEFSSTRNRALKRAAFFFSQALIPLGAAQRATQRANRVLLQRNETLRQHTAALAKINRRLEREVARREAGQAAIRRGKERYQKLFAESQLMQRKLRQLTRQIISAQEEERKEIS
ncbi:MAG: hypothetical protein ABIZ81_04690, partial [Opitutaceae bacterium]